MVSFSTLILLLVYVGIYDLISLPQLTTADILAIEPGGDGVLYGKVDFVADLCNSPTFSLSNLSIFLDTNTTEWYRNWTINYLSDYLGDGNQSVLEITGNHLFGVSNLVCDLANEACTPMPSCQDIADHMGLDPKVPVCETQKLELLRRYLLSQMINGQMLYFKEVKNGFAAARITMQGRINEIVTKFTTQKDLNAVNKCQNHKQMVTAFISAAVVVVSVATYGIGSGLMLGCAGGLASTGTRIAFTAANAPVNMMSTTNILLRVSPQIVGGSITIANTFAQNVGYGAPLKVEGLGPLNHTATQLFLTQLDHGMCKGIQDQNDQNTNDMGRGLEEMFMSMENNIIAITQAFGKGISNATAAANGQTAILEALESHHWLMVLTLPNYLERELSWRMATEMTENLVSQAMRSAQCYIQCSPTTRDVVDYQLSEESRIKESKPKGSDHDLATFSPTLDFCNRRSDTKDCPAVAAKVFGHENLICRFACVPQTDNDDDHHTPLWPVSLRNLVTSRFGIHPHRVFSDAVLADRVPQSYFFHGDAMLQTNFSTPAFNLPTCVSSTAFRLTDPIKHDNRDDEFEFFCGDWSANETRQFLGGMPIGKDSVNFQSGDLTLFYTYNLDKRMSNNIEILEDMYKEDNTTIHSTPLIRYLVYCEAGVAQDYKRFGLFQYSHDYKFYPNLGHAQQACDTLRNEIKDMEPLEATFYFCFGPTVAQEDDRFPEDDELCEDYVKIHQEKADEYKKAYDEWVGIHYTEKQTPFRYPISQ